MRNVKRRNPERHIAAIDDEPVLYEHLELYWEAFYRLNQKRPPSLGGLPALPTEEIVLHGQLVGMAGHDLRRFVKYIEALDTAYRTYRAESAEQEGEAKEDGKKSSH